MMELSRYPHDRQICGMQISSCKLNLVNKQIESVKDGTKLKKTYIPADQLLKQDKKSVRLEIEIIVTFLH